MFKNFFNSFVNFVKEHITSLFFMFLLIVIVLSLFTSCQGLFNVNAKDSDSEVIIVDSLKGGD